MYLYSHLDQWLSHQEEKTSWDVQKILGSNWNRNGISSDIRWDSRQENRVAETIRLHGNATETDRWGPLEDKDGIFVLR